MHVLQTILIIGFAIGYFIDSRRSQQRTELQLAVIYDEVLKMTQALTRLTASVAAMATIDSSVLTLVGSLAEQIRNNVDDSDALNALADGIDAQAASLAAAVKDNTPQASEPVQAADPAADPAPEPQTEG